jgi:hypothetical protein
MEEIVKAYALLSSLKQNIPNNFQVDQKWVNDFHNALQKIESTVPGTSLQEFRISPEELTAETSGGNYLTGTVDYSGRTVVDRTRLLLKVDAVLGCFQYIKDQPTKGKLGFSKD